MINTNADRRQKARSRLLDNTEIILNLIEQGRTVQLSPSRTGLKILHYKPMRSGLILESIPDDSISEGVDE